MNNNNSQAKPVMVAEQVLSQIQVERMPYVPGLNPAQDYDIYCSELEITCRYSNSRALGDLRLLSVFKKIGEFDQRAYVFSYLSTS